MKKRFQKVNSTEFIPKSSKRRLAALVLMLCIFSALVTGTFVYVLANPSPTSTYYGEEGIYPGAPSYTVWREDSTYYAKDANGHVTHTTANASSLFRDIFSSTNIKVAVESGVYVASFNVSDNTILTGEDDNTIIKAPDSSDNDAVVNIVGNNVTVSHLTVNGNGEEQSLANGHGIKVDGSSASLEKITIEYNRVAYTANHGIFVYGESYEITNVLIQHNEVYETGNSSLCTVGTHGYGIFGARSYSNIRVLYNYVHDTYGGVGVCFGVDASQSFVPYNTQIVGNTLLNNKRYGIDTSGTTDINIRNNYIDNPDTDIVDTNTIGIFFEAVSPPNSNSSHITNNYISRQGCLGIYVISPTTKLIIRGNTLTQLLGSGGSVHIALTATSAKNISTIKVTENFIDGINDTPSADGINLYTIGSTTIQNITISQNHIFNLGSSGIYLSTEYVTDIIISNNFCNNNVNGIRLTASSDNIILGNKCDGNSNVGILEDGACDYNVIVSSSCKDNGSSGIVTVGANTKVNLCWNDTSWIS